MYGLLGLVIIYMFIQIRPLLMGIYTLVSAVLAPFLLAMIISYVLNPIVELLNKRRVPRTIAILLIYTIFIISLTVIVMNLIPMFTEQLTELNEHIPQMTMKAQSLMTDFNDNQLLPESVRMGINKAMLQLENGITMAISNYLNGIVSTFNTLFIAFIIPFLAFYILKDFHVMERAVLSIVPRNLQKQTIQMLVDMDHALGGYIHGQFLVCIIVGCLSYVGYWIIGMPYALLLASVVAIFNIVPYLGPFIGAAPALIMSSMMSWEMVLYAILVNTIVQILESNIISPQVVGRTLHMHPLLIIFALLVGGEFAGLLGLILAVPFFAVMKVMIHHFFLNYINRRMT